MQIINFTKYTYFLFQADVNTFGTPVNPAINWTIFNMHITKLLLKLHNQRTLVAFVLFPFPGYASLMNIFTIIRAQKQIKCT